MSTDFTYTFNAGHAKKYGVNEAIMLCCFIFWISKNEANGKHFHDGRTWTYNSVAAFEKLFPFWTKKQIRGVLDSLERQGVIMKGNYNEQKYDRTSWYGFTDEFLKSMFPEGQIHVSQKGKSICPKGQMEMPEKANRNAEKGKPIPVILPDTLPDNSSTNVLQYAAKAAVARVESDPEVLYETEGQPECEAQHSPAHEPATPSIIIDEEVAPVVDAQPVDQPSAKDLQPAAGEKKKSSAKKRKGAAAEEAVDFYDRIMITFDDVNDAQARAFVKLRDAKRAAKTEGAWKDLVIGVRKAQALGYTANQFFHFMCYRGWYGCNAGYVFDKLRQAQPEELQDMSVDEAVAKFQHSSPAARPAGGYNRPAPAAKPSKFEQNTQSMLDAIEFLNNRV